MDRLSHAYLYLIAILILLSSVNVASAEKVHDREYKIKTAFMLNFFKLTHWQHKNSRHKFLFCSSNKSFSNIAKDSLKSKSVHGKKIDIITVLPNQEINCDALFITKYENSQWENRLKNKRHLGTLLIGERSGFAKKLGHIKFFRINNKLRFQVNLATLKQDKLKMSPQLLRLADVLSAPHKSKGNKNGVIK